MQEWDGALGPQEEKVIDRLGFLLNACESLDCTKVDPAVMLVDFSEVFVWLLANRHSASMVVGAG